MFCYRRNKVYACQHTGCAKRDRMAKLDRVARPDFLNGELFARPVRRTKAGATRAFQNRARFSTHILNADGSTSKPARRKRTNTSSKNSTVVTYGADGKTAYQRQMEAAQRKRKFASVLARQTNIGQATLDN